MFEIQLVDHTMQNNIVLIFVLIDWLKIWKLNVYINVNFKQKESFFKLQQHVIDKKRDDDQFMHLSILNKREYNVNNSWNYFKMSRVDETSHVICWSKLIFFVWRLINFVKNET